MGCLPVPAKETGTGQTSGAITPYPEMRQTVAYREHIMPPLLYPSSHRRKDFATACYVHPRPTSCPPNVRGYVRPQTPCFLGYVRYVRPETIYLSFLLIRLGF